QNLKPSCPKRSRQYPRDFERKLVTLPLSLKRKLVGLAAVNDPFAFMAYSSACTKACPTDDAIKVIPVSYPTKLRFSKTPSSMLARATRRKSEKLFAIRFGTKSATTSG